MFFVVVVKCYYCSEIFFLGGQNEGNRVPLRTPLVIIGDCEIKKEKGEK